jgi:hypothetical protein
MGTDLDDGVGALKGCWEVVGESLKNRMGELEVRVKEDLEEERRKIEAKEVEK